MTELETFCSELKQRIESEYNRLGYDKGWRLLGSPKTTLETADTALIGLNPGGDRDFPDHPSFCMPEGQSSFVDEIRGHHQRGQAPLQNQVRSLFQKLGRAPHEVLCGEFIPFRSRNHAALPRALEAENFARKLWCNIFSFAKPELVIALGNTVFYGLHGVLGCSEVEEIPINWGNVKARRTQCEGCVLVGVPHLSQYRFINREASQEGLDKMFRDFLA